MRRGEADADGVQADWHTARRRRHAGRYVEELDAIIGKIADGERASIRRERDGMHRRSFEVDEVSGGSASGDSSRRD
jgi:hypothetical protein